MFLSKEEERMLRGDYGEAVSEAMKIIVKVGEALSAERLIPVTHAHASGISYGTIGEPGLYWLKSLGDRGAKVRIFSTVNPIGMDIDDPHKIPVGREFYEKQIQVLESLSRMGFRITVTCTPYYIRSPKVKEHLAWGESSAVAYANSVLGAYTNREGGMLTIAAAIVGRTYYGGMHLDENRVTKYKVTVKGIVDPTEWSAIGLEVGEIVGGNVPRYINAPGNELSVKLMLAASAASGSVALSVIEGLTPNGTYHIGDEEKIELGRDSIEKYFGNLEDAELIFHGCPHSSLEELEYLNSRIKEVSGKREVWIATSPHVYSLAEGRGTVRELERKGVKVVKGTCSVVTPLEKLGFRRVATTSAKTYFYLKRKGLDVWLVRLSDIKEVI